MVKQSSKKINKFWLGNVSEKIAGALESVIQQVDIEFPKDKSRWLSQYKYRKRKRTSKHYSIYCHISWGVSFHISFLITFNIFYSTIYINSNCF
ncbi:putative aminotransferase [Clostridium ljungdahlii DSM 13528]|uniref:Putative aminotransferase n=1 Tax=Clostridium ljungdahlii (strain ATCC 55383 / DSM 13528 / PETC) TaxID=748727 RepID=D8GP69_CLOLD|nr:putative aminotransferase [Clostridium ljungdahlii DSM 13528]